MTALEYVFIAFIAFIASLVVLISVGLLLSAVDRYRRLSKKRRAAWVARVLLEREARRQRELDSWLGGPRA